MKYPDRYVFPAIFQQVEEGAREVVFPVLDNAFTATETLETFILEAKYVLEDVLYFTEREKLSVLAATPLNEVKATAGAIIQSIFLYRRLIISTSLLQHWRQHIII